MFSKEIFNEEGERILQINISESFIGPHLILDTLKEKEKTPEIKVSENINILKDIEFLIYAKPTDNPWAKRQKNILFLRPDNSPLEDDFKQLNKLPANHFLEVDIANSKIRLVGAFVNRSGVGAWMVF